MRPLRYSINVTLDGCCDHTAVMPDAELHQHAADGIARADALLLGRVTYQMMEDGWRGFAERGERPEWMEPWMDSFAHTIHGIKKFVVSRSLPSVDWNAELIRDDLLTAVRALKAQPGKGIGLGGVTLPLALAAEGLIDEYEFIVHPVVAGRGPWLLAGLPSSLNLELVERREFRGGAMALRYVPRR